MEASPINVLDLFAGAGGLSRGFHTQSSRFRTIAAVEMDIAAAAAFAANFPEASVFAEGIEEWLGDEAKLPSNIHVIVGGPPCQGFSTLGKQDVEDERNLLWRQYAETIRRVRPMYFVVENVAAFAVSPQFAQFRAELESDPILADYTVKHDILNAADYGVPQARRRTVMVGSRKDVAEFQWPKKTHAGSAVTVSHALRDVPLAASTPDALPRRTTEFGGKTLAGPFNVRELHFGRNYSKLSLDRFRHIPEGGNRFSLPDELLAPCWRKHKTGSGDVMGRLRADRPAVTIRTEFFKPEKGRYLHPTENRAITHLEAALLQGFPESHVFVGSKTAIARQIGNAVPIALASAIAASIEAAIDESAPK